MKQGIATIIFFVIISLLSFGYAQEEAQQPAAPAPEEVGIGNIYFPRPFIQAGKDYQKGVYTVKIVYKDSGPVFLVYKKDDMLFEEIAVIKKLPEGKKNSVKRFKVRKDFLKDFEYFRLRVMRPDHTLFAYFMTKKKTEIPEAPEQTPEKQI